MSKKTTKRALAMSFVSVFLCVCMLVGTTFAWFTDSVTSSNNVIKSGTLDVTMEWKDATANGAQQTYKDASTGAIFDYAKWEPGYVEAKNVKITNAGTLALKYQLNIVANGAVSELADVIDVYYADGEYTLASREMTELTRIGTLTEVLNGMPASTSAEMLAGDVDTVTIALKMKETADNKYQNLDIGSDFAVQLLATQLTYESDSFDDLYDQNAGYAVEVNSADALADALRGGGLVKLTGDIAVSESMTIPAGVTVNLDLNGQTITGANTTDVGAVVENNGTLTITNGTIENTTVNGAEAVVNNGTMVLKDVTVKGAPMATTGYPAYAVGTSGKLTIEEGTKVYADRGALRTSDGAELTINGGEFIVSDAADGRNMMNHVVYAYGANTTVTINDGYFEYNHTSTGGASVVCPYYATIIVNGGDFRDAMDDSNWTSVGNFQNYMGTKAPVVYGGTYDDTTHQKWLAPGYVSVENGDGTWTVGPKKISASEADTAIAAGGAFELTEDVTISANISKDVTIDLGDKTLTMTGSDLKTTGDLELKNGAVDVSAGYFDVRSASDKEVVIEDVVFTSTKQGLTHGNSTDRVEPAMEFCPEAAGVKTTFVFRNCTFNNANVVFEAMSGKDGAFDVVFEKCTFNLFGNSEAIEVSNYLTGEITIKDCTFNITATSNVYIVYALSSSTVTVNFEGSNTVNGTAATPTTDPALAGTVNEVKVFSSQSVKIAGGVDVVNGLDTVTVTGIATK